MGLGLTFSKSINEGSRILYTPPPHTHTTTATTTSTTTLFYVLFCEWAIHSLTVMTHFTYDQSK